MKSGKIAVGAIIGAAVGIAAGVLTAPKSGRETRDDIKHKAQSAKGKATTKRDDLLYKAEETADDLRTKAKNALKDLRSSGKK